MEDLAVDGSIILKLVFWNRLGGCGLYSCSSGYRPARAVVDTEMSDRFPYKARNLLTVRALACQGLQALLSFRCVTENIF